MPGVGKPLLERPLLEIKDCFFPKRYVLGEEVVEVVTSQRVPYRPSIGETGKKKEVKQEAEASEALWSWWSGLLSRRRWWRRFCWAHRRRSRGRCCLNFSRAGRCQRNPFRRYGRGGGWCRRRGRFWSCTARASRAQGNLRLDWSCRTLAPW